jgi:L-Ala-D/L-Glu epimerase
MRVELQEVALRFAEPLETAYGTLAERHLIVLSLTGADGVTGRGEAAPLEPYDGVSLDHVRAALEAYRPILAGAGDASGAQLLDACRAAADLPQAIAAVDMALWDRAGRREGVPVAALLCEHPATAVAVNASIAVGDRAGASAAAARAARAGYRCVKLKVGLPDDAGRVAAVRAALGPHAELRLDANGAWDPDEAVRMIGALAPAGLELVEEPVHGLIELRAVRDRVSVRVAMDETTAQPGALASGATDAVCLKVSACGGIGGVLAAASLVRATGAEAYLASTYDGPLGIAAALHAGAALAPLPHCGLATLGLFEGLAGVLPIHEGRIAVPTGPGLGVDP